MSEVKNNQQAEMKINSKKRNFNLNELFELKEKTLGEIKQNNQNKIITTEEAKKAILELDI